MGISDEIRKLEDRITAIESREKPFSEKEFRTYINRLLAEDCLEAGLKEAANYGKFSEREISLLEKKASQMKQEVNDFIDSQKQRIIAASEARMGKSLCHACQKAGRAQGAKN